MIVVDTSALMAIFQREPDMNRFARVLYGDAEQYIAAPTAFEFAMVVSGGHAVRARGEAVREADVLLSRLIVVPWDNHHLAFARAAFLRYGKGQGHPARLNFGDCMSYALAKTLDAPLLYKGDAFVHTDIRAAL